MSLCSTESWSSRSTGKQPFILQAGLLTSPPLYRPSRAARQDSGVRYRGYYLNLGIRFRGLSARVWSYSGGPVPDSHRVPFSSTNRWTPEYLFSC